MAFNYSRGMLGLVVGSQDGGSVTSSPNIDSAFTFESSGDVYAIKFVSPVAQTSETLTVYAFVTAVTGTPSFSLEVRKGYQGTGDSDRPETGGANLASGASTVSSPSATTWVTFTCTVTLTLGDVFWILIKNTHATPASNHATFCTRGSLDSTTQMLFVNAYIFQAGYSLDGFTTDPTMNNNAMAPVVLKFGDGSLMGCPWVGSTNHASNANNRGVRVQFSEDVVVSGLLTNIVNAAYSTGLAIYQNGSTVLTEGGDYAIIANNNPQFRFAPTTLSGGVAYDVVLTFSNNATQGVFYHMGQAEGSVPADVKACLPSYLIGSVDSATSSFTPDTSQTMFVALLVDDNPAIAGGVSLGAQIFGG
ncbi:MAG: hypothetical protein OEW98_00235 [Betaproteobacteria bacterium]|nr:hypothetical protein [Betaproteobacteria bacterium]